MRRIDAETQRLGHLHFHLKAGRALEYVRGHAAEGRNDWDTSVLIDPDLPPDAWHARFTAVHNALVPLLLRAKRAFFVLAHRRAAETAALRDREPAAGSNAEEASDEDLYDHEASGFEHLLPALPDDDEDRDGDEAAGLILPAYSAACKAELIDIGIPRRDTVAAMEHWHHIGPAIIRQPWTDGIAVPPQGNRVWVKRLSTP
ncbi:hypothetical protein [Paracoccus sp. (in: a-proteobacteria)]|uniref:hypothetical protein n=1 Tax=Paracoccus sp. TaxID=267 RepID=UPI0032200CA1